MDAPRIVSSRGVGFPGTAANPQRPGDRYERMDIDCPEPECDDRKTLTPEGLAPASRLLSALLAGEIRRGLQFDHPSGAPAIAVNIENLFGHRRV